MFIGMSDATFEKVTMKDGKTITLCYEWATSNYINDPYISCVYELTTEGVEEYYNVMKGSKAHYEKCGDLYYTKWVWDYITKNPLYAHKVTELNDPRTETERYLVFEKFSSEFEIGDLEEEPKVYNSLEDAKRYFDYRKSRILSGVEGGWEHDAYEEIKRCENSGEKTKYAIDEDDKSFYIYEDGRYTKYHTDLYIKKIRV